MCGEASSVNGVSGPMMGSCKQGASRDTAKDVTRDGLLEMESKLSTFGLARCVETPKVCDFVMSAPCTIVCRTLAVSGACMINCLDRILVQMTQIHCRSRAAWTSALTR